MVAFVLENDGGETINPLGDVRPLRGAVRNVDAGVAGDHAAQSRQGQAAFLADGDLPGEAVNLDIDIRLERLSGQVQALQADDASVDADLRGGDPYASLGRVVDRGEHLGDERLQLRGAEGALGDVARTRAQEDAVLGHDRDIHYGVGLGDDFPFPGGPGIALAGQGAQQQRHAANNKTGSFHIAKINKSVVIRRLDRRILEIHGQIRSFVKNQFATFHERF